MMFSIMMSFCCFLFDVLVLFIFCGMYIGDGFQRVVNVPENGRRFQRVCSLQYLGGRFNHVATRTTCFVPMWPKPTGMSNNLRIMVMPCRILKTCLQCNFLSLAETNSILPILNDSHH